MKFINLLLAALPAVWAQSSSTTRSASATSSTSSASASSSTLSTNPSSSTPLAFSGSVVSTILIIARDQAAANSASSGLNGYGIPFQTLLVPQAGAALPVLNSSATSGNFGGIMIVSQVSYDYGTAGGGFKSALTDGQWKTLYAYQIDFGVRMVQLDVYPGPLFGATALGGCCGAGVEQLISFSNTTAFAQAGINRFAGVTSQGLYHYPASISDPATTWEVAQFGPGGSFTTNTTAAVINSFSSTLINGTTLNGNRQQFATFIGVATEWSPTSNFMQHAYITWITRGLYVGFRRVNLNTQIDDVMLATDIYAPTTNPTWRTTPNDMAAHAAWIPTVQAKMNPGSFFRVELGYNGNGNIIAGEDNTACAPGSIDTGDHNDTALEFQKPLGTGSDAWPANWPRFNWTDACLNVDPLKVWFGNAANRAQFMHLSHTFTHYELNNATYADALKEIQFNQAWMQRVGITSGNFSADALIPPAITGTHNGDVIRAWTAAGLTNCVGDNTRPLLRNSQNVMWPYITNTAGNGYDGFTIIPRWATRIYYNCDTGYCTTTEWINTSAGSGTFNDLLAVEKADTMRHLFGLYREGYMFHQANLRTEGVNSTTINGQTKQYSIFQAWTETVVQEFGRLVNWPMLSLKQTDLATVFKARMARDQCAYSMKYTSRNGRISSVTVSTNSGCNSSIPLTVPASVTSTQGYSTEKVGNDPLTIWTKGGTTFTLSASIPW